LAATQSNSISTTHSYLVALYALEQGPFHLKLCYQSVTTVAHLS